MANQIYIPLINPVKFVPVGAQTYSNIDNDWFKNQIRNYEKPDNYAQKWIVGTPIKLQMHSNFGPVQINLIHCDGSAISASTPVAVITGFYDNGFTTWEFSIAPPAELGWWYMVLNVGFEETFQQFISEPQQTLGVNIIAGDTKNILTFEATNNINDQDVYFAGGLKLTSHVEGIIHKLVPKAKRALWEDQPLDLHTISAIPFREFEMVISDAYGVPDYMPDKLNRLMCCTTVKINGVEYTQVDGAEWEPTDAEYYARRGWKTTLRQADNRPSIVGENNGQIAELFAVVYNIDTKAFGTFNGNVSNNIMQITEVE